MPAAVYLIPSVLSEGQIACLPSYLLEHISRCSVLFVENERTARRYLKLLSPQIIIDDFEWYNMKEITEETRTAFRINIKEEKSIGIISEAGCPGIADPGQELIYIAQQMNVPVHPLVGPNSIILALMASGMNGQRFQFLGYLPIEAGEKMKAIRQLEAESKQKDCTQIFIETPFRNNQMMETLLKTLQPQTKICVAVDLTSKEELIRTNTVREWKKEIPQLHKRPCIFLIYAV
jgi:16S rRNA (cytidine1402-2'-O)-methyltransferase